MNLSLETQIPNQTGIRITKFEVKADVRNLAKLEPSGPIVIRLHRLCNSLMISRLGIFQTYNVAWQSIKFRGKYVGVNLRNHFVDVLALKARFIFLSNIRARRANQEKFAEGAEFSSCKID